MGAAGLAKALLGSRFSAATGLCRARPMKPKMTTTRSIASFAVPRKLLSVIPHFLDILCSIHANVFAASAMPTIAPLFLVTLAASRTPMPKAMELTAVFPKAMNEIPKRHVARNLGVLKK